MKIKLLLSVCGIGLALSSTASAASCQSKAAALAAKRKAEVLNVKSVGNSCKIKLLIKSKDSAPKRKIIKVKK